MKIAIENQPRAETNPAVSYPHEESIGFRVSSRGYKHLSQLVILGAYGFAPVPDEKRPETFGTLSKAYANQDPQADHLSG